MEIVCFCVVAFLSVATIFYLGYFMSYIKYGIK